PDTSIRRTPARPPPACTSRLPASPSRSSCGKPWWSSLSLPARMPLSFLHLFEIAQIGRLLALLHRHEVTVRAQHVGVAADADMRVVLDARVLAPYAVR